MESKSFQPQFRLNVPYCGDGYADHRNLPVEVWMESSREPHATLGKVMFVRAEDGWTGVAFETELSPL